VSLVPMLEPATAPMLCGRCAVHAPLLPARRQLFSAIAVTSGSACGRPRSPNDIAGCGVRRSTTYRCGSTQPQRGAVLVGGRSGTLLLPLLRHLHGLGKARCGGSSGGSGCGSNGRASAARGRSLAAGANARDLAAVEQLASALACDSDSEDEDSDEDEDEDDEDDVSLLDVGRPDSGRSAMHTSCC